MEQKKRFFWLWVIIAGLVQINVGILFRWWDKQHQPPDPPASAKAYLEKELKLNGHQQQQYDKLRKQHFSFTRQMNEENRHLRDQFFDGIKDSSINSSQSDSVARLIAVNQMRIDTATLHHFRQFRKILNTAQQQRFDDIINRVLRMMGGPHPPRGSSFQRPDGPPPGPGGLSEGPPPDE